MELNTTGRGFALLKFEDSNGVACSLQKSSAATEDKIWLGCDDADPKVCVYGKGWVPVEMPDGYLATTRTHDRTKCSGRTRTSAETVRKSEVLERLGYGRR